jgi:hypothetical protein
MASTLKQYPTNAIQDGSLTQTVALPASAGTVNTNAIDMGTVNTVPFPTSGEFTVQLSIPASVTNGPNVQANIAMQMSLDGTNWVAAPIAIGIVSANVNVASTTNINLDPSVYRYIRAQAVTTGTGNVSDTNLTIKLLF